MDEYPLEVWQNVPRHKNLEPLAKLLRHIDRFEKVMQKQKSRLTRRIARQTPGELGAPDSLPRAAN